MNAISCLCHIEACGLYAACGIRTGNKELVNSILFNELCKFLARKRICLRLHKDIIGYHLHFRNQLSPFCVRLKGSGSRRQIIMLDIDDLHILCHSPVDSLIDTINDLFVVLSNVILNVNYHQRFVSHGSFPSFQKLRMAPLRSLLLHIFPPYHRRSHTAYP